MERVMADAAKGVRQLVLVHGRDAAKELVDPDHRSLVNIASEVLGDDSGRKGYSYSGLCLTSLPHRKLADDQAWERTVGPLTLIIEPGRIKLGDGPSKMAGVPHGARARLILIYLQTQAVLTSNREVSLGRSMREWMGRMGLSVGGETARALREQARRIAACSMRFSWKLEGRSGQRPSSPTMMTNERIIKSGLFFHDTSRSDDRQENLFEDKVFLDSDFFDQLRRHPVPLHDGAIRQLKNSSTALDVYVWLAFRLHHLEKRTPIGWKDLYQQFGAGYRHLWAWKPYFLESLAEAVAAYPEARVDVEDSHIMLHPSPPPVAKLKA
ncbi:replication protein RepA [Roseomonas gilardii]|uniref:replication protein RepA n=1 Tax=Roseomonas gilardii TaxID=257708 RepID=UPI001EEF480E|nr:replication protein RepA [Roseomonas gilardii]